MREFELMWLTQKSGNVVFLKSIDSFEEQMALVVRKFEKVCNIKQSHNDTQMGQYRMYRMSWPKLVMLF